MIGHISSSDGSHLLTSFLVALGINCGLPSNIRQQGRHAKLNTSWSGLADALAERTVRGRKDIGSIALAAIYNIADDQVHDTA